jgi:hypothetical protein
MQWNIFLQVQVRIPMYVCLYVCMYYVCLHVFESGTPQNEAGMLTTELQRPIDSSTLSVK